MLLIVCRPIIIRLLIIRLYQLLKNILSNARRIFSQRLRQIRQNKGLSQEELADVAGLHRTYVGSVERGERNISIDNMERLAKALEVDITDLLKEETE
jgi:ribosome-binding protein aMBF1 (putative translation factor)